MTTWIKKEVSSKITYTMADGSLPTGCTHFGFNQITVWKESNGYHVEQQACSHFSGGQTWDGTIKNAIEMGNIIVS